MVIDFIQQIGVLKAEKKYLHFARIDRIESLKEVEGVVFIANPDMLSGLTTWAYYCLLYTSGERCRTRYGNNGYD